jgi:hypothetical protein
MSTPAKINFKLYQGSTFSEVLRWESSLKTYVPITGISKSAPIVITAPAHGVPVEWRVKFTNILGMTELNSNDAYYQATSVTSDTITINEINSLGFKSYTSGGVVEYNTPINLTGFTARMQVRSKIDSTTVIVELTTENGYIVIDNTTKTITLNIPATVTAAFTFATAVYSLEILSGGGKVTPFCEGTITLVKEVTR